MFMARTMRCVPMWDNLIHSPHNLVVPDVELRNAMASAIGMVPDVPRTVRTGCDKRRAVARTSFRPESVTCAACRAYAAATYRQQADSAMLVADLPGVDRDKRASWYHYARKLAYLADRFLGKGVAVSYIVLRPNSNSNPTDEHWVARYQDWLRFSEGDVSGLTPVSTHADYKSAEAEADQLNRAERLKVEAEVDEAGPPAAELPDAGPPIE